MSLSIILAPPVIRKSGDRFTTSRGNCDRSTWSGCNPRGLATESFSSCRTQGRAQGKHRVSRGRAQGDHRESRAQGEHKESRGRAQGEHKGSTGRAQGEHRESPRRGQAAHRESTPGYPPRQPTASPVSAVCPGYPATLIPRLPPVARLLLVMAARLLFLITRLPQPVRARLLSIVQTDR